MSERLCAAPPFPDALLVGGTGNLLDDGAPPTPLTSFVGRERETAAVVSLLRSPELRLITLIGPGGVGKTRLALRVADLAAADFPGGVRFVRLAPVREAALIASAIAHVLGVREANTDSLAIRIAAIAVRGRTLLILDNFEHVVDAAPLVADLLSTCQALTCLATSRAVLQISGEHTFPVPPLPLVPDVTPASAARAQQSTAIQLFVVRAQATRPDFHLDDANATQVVTICHRLDGLPLAIELAAARMRHMPVAELAARLAAVDGAALRVLASGPRDMPSRQKTLRATVAWSHDLLTPDEQSLFRRLAIFVGGFSAEAAAQVAMADAGPATGLDAGIASLLDQSLLYQTVGAAGEARYGMLETIREFGLERLATSGEEASTRARHAAWCLTLAEVAGRFWERPDPAGWLRRLAREWPNLQAAVAWALEHGNPSLVLRLTRALHDAVNGWGLGDPLEMRHWLDAALAMGERADLALRVDALGSAAVYAAVEGDLTRADALAQQALTLARSSSNRPGEADALHALGLVASFRGDLNQMETMFARSLELWRASGDMVLVGHTLNFLADAALGTGDITRAAALSEEARTLLDGAGNVSFQCRLLGTMGDVALVRREPARAAQLYGDFLARAVSFGHARYVADALVGLAGVAQTIGDAETAALLLGAAAGQMMLVGARSMVHPVTHRRILADTRQHLSGNVFTAAWDAGRALGREAAVAVAQEVAAVAAMHVPQTGDTASPFGLSPRELDVLRLLVEGRSDAEIGEALFISRRTASKHVGSILAKLAVSSRVEAALRAVRELPF